MYVLRYKILLFSLFRYGERLLYFEELSLAAVKEMVQYWKSFEGKPFDPQRSIHDAVGKIMTSLVNKIFRTTEPAFIES